LTLGDRTRRRLLLVAAVSSLWIVLASLLVVTRPELADRVDRGFGMPIAAFADRHPWIETTAEVVAALTRFPPMLLYTVVVAGVLVAKGFRRPALWIVAVSCLTASTTTVLKVLFGRPRPEYSHMALRDLGFPSGHSSGMACAAGLAIVLAAVFLRRRNQRRLVAAVGVGLTLLIGLDRLLLGVHGVLDVLTGYAVAAVWVSLAAYVVDPTPRLGAAPSPRAAEPATGPRRLTVILNPAKLEDPDDFRRLVDARARELGYGDPAWAHTTVEDPGRSMAEQAVRDGTELVLVCGGDGTVRTVCAALAGTGIPVGVVPAGTGNLLARNLALPLYLNGAVEVALTGLDREIDLVRVSGDGLGDDEHFLVMAGMGFDAAIMEGANDAVKARIGWLAYVVSAARNLTFPAVRIEVSLDGGPATRHRVRTIVVGNVGFLQARLPLLPDATLDDGLIDVVLVNPRRFLDWLLVVARVLFRGTKLDDTVNRMTARTVVIRAATGTPRQIDGDPVGAGRELTCECLAGQLVVRVAR
jgi:diacylglycerol kinase family enzyme/membrane-associated phospholipid phosphatase